MTFKIKEITTRKEMKRFSRFPLKLYKNHPQYAVSYTHLTLPTIDSV